MINRTKFVKQKEIAKELGVCPGTVSMRLKKLREEGNLPKKFYCKPPAGRIRYRAEIIDFLVGNLT